MKRRTALWTLAAAGWPAAQAQLPQDDLPALLRAGRCVVMLRHAQTEPGIGDPPNFRLDQCATQRNLSDEGRAQARRIGQWFSRHGLAPAEVQSSPWCRCRDTAELAFGRYKVLPALGSTFGSQGDPAAYDRTLRALLRAVPAGRFEVWVTHQVNITALSGGNPSMGEAFVIDAGGTIRARTQFG